MNSKWRRVVNLLLSNRTPWLVILLSEREGVMVRKGRKRREWKIPPKDMSHIKNKKMK
jgi:hypothetical protein